MESADDQYNSSLQCLFLTGLAIGGNCMFIGMLIGLIIISIGLILAIVALALTCHLRKEIAKQDPKRKKKAPPPPEVIQETLAIKEGEEADGFKGVKRKFIVTSCT